MRSLYILVALASSCSSLVACEQAQQRVGGSAGTTASVAPEAEAPEIKYAIIGTPSGVREVAYEEKDGFAITEGDIGIGTVEELESGEKGAGAMLRSFRWPRFQVPFAFANDVPTAKRTDINAAIAHWQSATPFRFIPKTNETEFVEFHNGNWCHTTAIGKTPNGKTGVHVTIGQSASEIVGLTTVKFNGQIIAWYADGLVSAGSMDDLDKDVAQTPFTMPPTKSISQIVGMAIDTDGRVTTWYNDNTFTVGSLLDLDLFQGPTAYSLPAGYTASRIRGMDFISSNFVGTWYDDGRASLGTTNNLAANAAPFTSVFPVGPRPSNVVEVGIDSAQRVLMFFTPLTTGAQSMKSIGVTTDLDFYQGLTAYAPPTACVKGAIIHEIGHAVGLWHEHTRCDRDTKVIVNLANVEPGKEPNFNPQFPSAFTCSGIRDVGSYDFGSIMHYGSFAFSKNGLPTMIKRSDGSTFVQQLNGLSAQDRIAVRELYGWSPAAGQSIASVRGIARNASAQVVVWHGNGQVTIGEAGDFDSLQGPQTFTVAAGKTLSQIMDMEMDANGRVYTWYSDMTESEGTITDLDHFVGARSFRLALNKGAFDLKAVALSNNIFYYYYTDGTVSRGNSTDGRFVTGPVAFTLAAGKTPAMIVDIASFGTGQPFTVWYNDSSLSVGTSFVLDSLQEAW